MSTSKFFAGAIIGVVAGLLLAPDKGENLRNDIVDSAGRLKRRLALAAGTTSAELSDLKDLLEQEIEGLNDDVRFRILTMLDEAGRSAGKIGRSISSELS